MARRARAREEGRRLIPAPRGGDGLDEPACHSCGRFDPGGSRCALHGMPVDPARHLCRDHTSGLHARRSAGRLHRIENTLLGVEILAERKFSAASAPARPFFCARCRAGSRDAATGLPEFALLFAAALSARGPLERALLDDAHLEACAAPLPPGDPPAERLAALLREPPDGSAPSLRLCARCRGRLAKRRASLGAGIAATLLDRLLACAAVPGSGDAI